VPCAVNCAETFGLGIVARASGSAALRAQTAAADVAVQVFFLIGMLISVRPPDQTRPLGYLRERFYWYLFAALGIFFGGGVLASTKPSAPRCARQPCTLARWPAWCWR